MAARSIITSGSSPFVRQLLLKKNVSNSSYSNNNNIINILRTSSAILLSSSLKRTYATEVAEKDDSNNNNSNTVNGQQQQQYVSPFQDIFNTIKDGKTFLGTSEFVIPQPKYLNCGIPEHVLKFKTTAFDRILEEPFVHTNEHRVTLQIDIENLNFSEDSIEMMVLKEVVGSRLNESTGVLQLSSNQFGSRIENKRHVVSMFERIIDSTKSLSQRIQQEVV